LPGADAAGPDTATDAGGVFPGRLTAAIRSGTWDSDRPFELCGSSTMVVEVRELLIGKGVPHSSIVSELYY
jgi:ferredoxin-NADP reductase